MPNKENINSPVVLVGTGRSGTTVISQLFGKHPDFSYVGETVNLIFNVWHAYQAVPYATNVDGKILSSEERSTMGVHHAFLTCFPDKKKYWFHKPINIPKIIDSLYDDSNWDEAAKWYWEVMRNSFPNAKFFTVLRNPCDVVVSSQAYWGFEQQVFWRRIGFVSYALCHPDSPVEYAINFEDLFNNRERTVRDFFDFLEIPLHEDLFEIFQEVHSPAEGREKIQKISATRVEERKDLDPRKALPLYRQSIERAFARFNIPFSWPEHFSQETTGQEGPGEAEDDKATISRLYHQIQKINTENAKNLQDQKAKADKTFKEQQAWIKELQKSKTWWQEEADRRASAQDYLRELRTSKVFQALRKSKVLPDFQDYLKTNGKTGAKKES